MSTRSTLRHSVVGRCVRRILHALYSLQHCNGQPVRYCLAPGVDIQLYPEGEIAEFLAVPGFFEKAEMALAAAYLKPGMKVIDVGANIGVYSIIAQQRVGETGAVWAFEPSSESYRRLLKNICLNNCNQVHPVQMALSDCSDTRLVLRSDPGFGDAHRYLVPASDLKDGGGEFVPVVTLDHYASQNHLGPVDFIKVDVEGCECMVFGGSRELLKSSPNVVVMFENDPQWCRRAGRRQQDTFELLRKLGFQLYGWDGRNRKWTTDEPTIFSASTVWASREAQRLPAL